MESSDKNNSLRETLSQKKGEGNHPQDIAKYFGSMKGAFGTMEEIDAVTKEDRIPIYKMGSKPWN